MARKVAVFLHDQLVGYLTQGTQGYVFQYDSDYQGAAISLSLPRRAEPYCSQTLPPFFQGLAPEGWLRKRYADLQQLDEQDLFGLLLNNGNDLLGAVVLKEVLE